MFFLKVSVSCGYPYSGLYANAHRGEVRKAEKGQPKFLIIEEECPRSLRRGWAAMIRKVYGVDPLCPGQEVWVISGFLSASNGLRDASSRSQPFLDIF